MRLNYKQLQQIDAEWPKLLLPTFVALVLLGGLFMWSGHSPWVAVGGVMLITAVVVVLRMQQLRRRVTEHQARMRHNADPQ